MRRPRFSRAVVSECVSSSATVSPRSTVGAVSTRSRTMANFDIAATPSSSVSKCTNRPLSWVQTSASSGALASARAAVGIVVIALLFARPIAVFLALTGTATDMTTRGFMAWFGPKGVATMTFALLVLSDRISAGTRIFNIAALVVFCSIIAHGLSDTPAAEWLARRYRLDGGEAAP